MKKLIFLLFLLSGSAWAQSTTVTASVTDQNGNPYANGTASALQLVASGQPFTSTTPVTTNGSGSFTFTLPSGSYVFTVCSQPVLLGPPTGNVPGQNPTPKQVCFSSGVIAISGATQDISGQLNALAPVIGPKGGSTTIVQGQPSNIQLIPNCTAGAGTRVNQLIQLSTQLVNGQTQVCAAPASASSSTVQGICTTNPDGSNNCGTSGTAKVATAGFPQCVFDNQTALNDLVTSSSTAGLCHDAGPIPPTTSAQIVGLVGGLNSGSGTAATVNWGAGQQSPGGGSSGGIITPSPQFQTAYYPTAGSTAQVKGDTGCTTDGNGNPTCNSVSTNGTGVGKEDFSSGGIPANPLAGFSRLFPNQNSGNFACLTSTGGDCFNHRTCYSADQAGADLGAQINNCDTFLGASSGTIFVSTSGTISTPVVVSSAGNNHTLFINPGVTITEAAGLNTPLSCSVGSIGCVITGSGSSSTINNLSTSYNGATFNGDAVTIGSKVSATWNATVTTTLTADAANAGTSLTVTSTTGFVAGQDILIKENGAGPSRYAEYNVLSSVTDGTHLALAHPLEHTYHASTNPTVAGFTAGSLTKNWEVSHLRITSSTAVPAATGSNSGVAAYVATDGLIHDLIVDHVGGRAILIGASGFPGARVVISHNIVHDTGLVPAGNGSPSIENYSQSSHVTIQGNQVWSVGGIGINSHGTFNIVDGNQVWWSGITGTTSTGSCYSSDTAENVTFSNNWAKNCVGRGFIMFGSSVQGTTESTRMSYINNHVEDAGLDCYDFGTSGSAGFVQTIVTGNTGLRCNGIGMLFEGNTGGYVGFHHIQNNLIESATSGYRLDQTGMGVQMVGNDCRSCTISYDLNSPTSLIFNDNSSESATTDLALGTADFSIFTNMTNTPVFTGTFGANSLIWGIKGVNTQLPTAAQNLGAGGNNLTGVSALTLTNGTTPLLVQQAPSILSGFGTSPSVPHNNGSAAFTVNVGTGGTASSGTVSMPIAASNGWACSVTDISTPANKTLQSATSTNSVTVIGFNAAGTQTAWAASDILSFQCSAY